jgi:hypothetical protein
MVPPKSSGALSEASRTPPIPTSVVLAQLLA